MAFVKSNVIWLSWKLTCDKSFVKTELPQVTCDMVFVKTDLRQFKRYMAFVETDLRHVKCYMASRKTGSRQVKSYTAFVKTDLRQVTCHMAFGKTEGRVYTHSHKVRTPRLSHKRLFCKTRRIHKTVGGKNILLAAPRCSSGCYHG